MSRASVLNEQDTTWEGCAVARASTLSRERGVMRLSRAAIVLSVLGVVMLGLVTMPLTSRQSRLVTESFDPPYPQFNASGMRSARMQALASATFGRSTKTFCCLWMTA
jgi:hypothetical protein